MAHIFDQNLGANSVTAGATTVTLTTAATAASGTRLFVLVSWFGTGISLSSVAGGSLTWVIDKQAADANNENGAIVSADAPTGLASSTVLTATFSASTPGSIGGVSFIGSETGASGYLTGTPPTPSSTFGSSSWTTPSITTADADALILGLACNDGETPLTSTATTGTEIHDRNTAATFQTLTSAYLIVSSIASYNLTGTWSVAGSETRGVTVAYRAAATGPQGPMSPITSFDPGFGPY